jgi:hypothetical protein
VYTESAIYFGVVLLDRDPSGLTTSDRGVEALIAKIGRMLDALR